MNKFKLILTSSILALAGLTGTAQASLYSVYIGLQCQPFTPSDAENLTYLSDDLVNYSNEIVYIACPIVRRNALNTNGTKSAYAIISGAKGANARCDFQSRRQQGTQADFRSGTTSSYRGTVNLDVNASGALGTYSLFCTLPPGGRMHSYGVEEFDVGANVNPTIVNTPTQPATVKSN